MFSWKFVYGWMDKIAPPPPKKKKKKKRENTIYLWSVVYQHKKTLLEICMLQIFATILTAGWLPFLLLYTSLVQVQQTTQMVGYCYDKYECWYSASV